MMRCAMIQWMLVIVHVCVLLLANGANVANAVSDTLGGVNADVGSTASYSWDGTLPNGETLTGVSTDVALPLMLSLKGAINSDTALQYIEVAARAEGETQAVPGTLVYHLQAEYAFVIWTPSVDLEPSTTYTVSIVVDNEGLGALGIRSSENLTAELTMTTAAEKLPLGLQPVVKEVTKQTIQETAQADCPDGEVVCDANGNTCLPVFTYTRSKTTLDLTWEDGEPEGTELFFLYWVDGVTVMNPWSTFPVDQLFLDEHLVTIRPGDEATENVCPTIKTVDLRSIARGLEVEEATSLTHCELLENGTSQPTTEDLAKCEPGEITGPIGGPDAGTISGSDSSSGGGGDDGACSVQTTRRSTHGAPLLGFLTAISAAGAGLMIARRRRG